MRSRSSAGRALGSFLAALLVTFPGAARAQTGGDQAAAEAFFREARELLAAGKVSEACGKFAESQRIDPKLGTLLNLAGCHEQEGKTATAWGEYSQAVGMALTAGQQARADFAKTRAAELEAKLSRVLFEAAPGVAGAAGLAIRLGDRELGAAAIGSKIPLDPGRYRVEVSATGKAPWSTEVELPPGPATVELRIPEFDAAAPPAPAPAPAPPPEPSSAPTRRAVGLVLGGVGLIGVGVGTTFGILTFVKKGTIADNCQGRYCNAEGLEASDDARASATLSTVGLIAGGALLAGGAALYLTAREAPEQATTAVWLAPEAGPAGAGLRLGGAW